MLVKTLSLALFLSLSGVLLAARHSLRSKLEPLLRFAR